MKRTKKILVSLLLVVGIGALVALGTRAFFSDSETSTGNLLQAGAVDLKVDSECHYYTWEYVEDGYTDKGCYNLVNGQEVPFGVWDSMDLTQAQRFFDFRDVKPGDWGENTISLTVEDNDAYACMYIENAVDDENVRIDPEVEAGDPTEEVGELGANLHFTAWLDEGYEDGWQGKCVKNGTDAVAKECDEGEGDNIWQGEDIEPLLFSNESGPASDVLGGKVYDLNGYGPLKGSETNYLGVLWCAGDLTIDGKEIVCNGETMGNDVQTDKFSADIRFYVEQSRNNPDFVCPPLNRILFVYDEESDGDEQNGADQPTGHGYNEPYVTWEEIEGNEIKFTFHNPTPWLYVFDVRVDNEGGVDRYDGPTNLTNLVINEGPLLNQTWGQTYQRVVVDGRPDSDIHQVSQTFSGNSKIKVGLREGAEKLWYFDWLEFNAVAQP